jgi:hypothetical protein
VVDLDKYVSKLYLLNLDKLLPIIKPLYSYTGRSAKNQQGIIRSLVLMLDLKEQRFLVQMMARPVKQHKQNLPNKSIIRK